jgi:hypothetical protein
MQSRFEFLTKKGFDPPEKVAPNPFNLFDDEKRAENLSTFGERF